MKTLKTLTTALLIILTANAFANDNDDTKKSEKLLMDYTIKRYINAISHGEVKGIAEIFDNDVKMTTTRNNEILNYGKSDILWSLKFTQDAEQNCTTDYKFLEMNPTQAVVKVTMKYEGFNKVNVVSLANTAKGWRITNISTSIN
ncbi:nuclear transport factor 2 family protein [Desertivirga arenae]|uniref:nuclear transport factor 2 family protein n=1 Tax=Desertivirga arenae TaxID=2810309 RepID=UPI001F618579|nr:nuclear transport factor 2 family protein [Pedobacter sp. SYSU D00823]